MKYQSALVLGTLAVGHAAAGNVRHASFHARRSETKRDMADVDWSKVSYDLSNVDWSTVDYNNPTPTPAPAASAPASSSPPEVATSAPAETKPEPSKEADPTSEAAPAKTSEASSGGDVVSDIFAGIEAFASSLGTTVGINSKTSNGAIWIGDDSDYKATFINDGDKDAAVICWGSKGMWINANQPQIFVNLKAGAKTTLSIAQGFSGGCGAAHADSDLSNGLLNESILEFTANDGANGCFDISREINMKGIVLSAKGSKCTSGVSGGQLSCTFVCTTGADQCGVGGGDYNIALGVAEEGPCMVGKDPYTGDPSGGCQMGNGEHMQVTIYGNRDWPS